MTIVVFSGLIKGSGELELLNLILMQVWEIMIQSLTRALL